MKNKKKGVLIAVVVIALIVAAVAAVCINKKAGDSGKLKEGQTETTVKKSDTKVRHMHRTMVGKSKNQIQNLKMIRTRLCRTIPM